MSSNADTTDVIGDSSGIVLIAIAGNNRCENQLFVIISLTRSCMSLQTGKSQAVALSHDEIFTLLKYQLM